LLEAQGEIHPGWNDEYLEARWVREVVTQALWPQAEAENPDTITGASPRGGGGRA
jgi:hypothetical protein